uniref:Uncharacterized protein n=1 Tax=Timema genevievae TaxID=629358 RepID=A0A7R9JSK7_TIMGE|nr:unnamed protein product [Timema genevievae]
MEYKREIHEIRKITNRNVFLCPVAAMNLIICICMKKKKVPEISINSYSKHMASIDNVRCKSQYLTYEHVKVALVTLPTIE